MITGKSNRSSRRYSVSFAAIGLVIGAAFVVYAGLHGQTVATAGSTESFPEITASLPPAKSDQSSVNLRKLPRFVSLKSDRVNVRRGPSSEHAIAWVYTRKSLPVEIIAEFEHWRRVRDSDGEEGWVYQSLLTGRRTAIVAPWIKGKTVPMLHDPASEASVVALLGPGVIGEVESCSEHWCRLNIDGHAGWIEQALLWGVYPDENIDD